MDLVQKRPSAYEEVEPASKDKSLLDKLYEKFVAYTVMFIVSAFLLFGSILIYYLFFKDFYESNYLMTPPPNQTNWQANHEYLSLILQ
uniref:Uncharacterized protein n=1 Tax=Ditylenchus dipsaci TaxID=166011 RepID=A0A915ETG1_9BILA